MKYKTFCNLIFLISIVSWISSWIIFAIKLDIIIYLGLILYGLGLSGLTIFFILKITENDN